MRKAILGCILSIIMLIPAYSGAQVIVDPVPVNLTTGDWPNCEAHYEYRDYGNYGQLNYVGGTQSNSGAYFFFDCHVVPGEALDNIDDVVNVKAKHAGTKRVYLLQRADYNWLGTPRYGFTLYLKPQDWMYEGKWKIILNYWDLDDEKHRQVIEVEAPEAFPSRVTNATVTREEGSFVISWNGIGDPINQTAIDYRVRVIAGEGNFIEDFRGDWKGGGTATTGTYDPDLNRVTFSIPDYYGGEAYIIRLENRLYQSRAVYYMVLPLASP